MISLARHFCIFLFLAVLLTAGILAEAASDDSSVETLSSVTLTKGSRTNFEVPVEGRYAASFESSDPAVASVSQSGEITAKKTGTATISGKIFQDQTLTAVYEREVNVIYKTSSVSPESEEINILFVGNSRTYVHNIPAKFKSLATSLGKNVSVRALTYPNATLVWHSENRYRQILSGHYDYVIIQDVSEQCINYPVFYRGAKAVSTLARKNNPDVTVLLRKMWKRGNDDEVLRDLAYDNTEKIAPKIGAILSYDGQAFELCSEMHPEWEPLQDNSHQSVIGAYLASCCIYAAVFNESPQGAAYVSTLEPEMAQSLQDIAALVS